MQLSRKDGYVAKPIGTSACIWCGEPINIYRQNFTGQKYSRFCSTFRRDKNCYRQNTRIQESWTRRSAGRSKKFRAMQKAKKEEELICYQLEVWWHSQPPEIQQQRSRNKELEV